MWENVRISLCRTDIPIYITPATLNHMQSVGARFILTPAAATGKLVAAIGVLHRVGRNGARTQLRDQIVVLRGLRCRQLEILILGLEVGQLALRQEVEDGAAVLVVRVDDVACGVLHGVARVARLRRKIVVDAADTLANIAAAACELRGNALRSKAALVALRDHAGINSGKTLRERVLHACKAGIDAIV